MGLAKKGVGRKSQGLIVDVVHVFKKTIHKFYTSHILPFGFGVMVVTSKPFIST